MVCLGAFGLGWHHFALNHRALGLGCNQLFNRGFFYCGNLEVFRFVRSDSLELV